MSNALQPHGLYRPWNSPDQNTGMGSRSLLQGILNPGIEPRSSTLQVDSLPAELQGKQGKPYSLITCLHFLVISPYLEAIYGPAKSSQQKTGIVEKSLL